MADTKHKSQSGTNKRSGLIRKIMRLVAFPVLVIFAISVFAILSQVNSSVEELTDTEIFSRSTLAVVETENFFNKYISLAEQLSNDKILLLVTSIQEYICRIIPCIPLRILLSSIIMKKTAKISYVFMLLQLKKMR